MDARQKLMDLAISDNGFVFDPYSGSTFSVNATGLAIIEALKRGESRTEINKALSDRFEVAEQDTDRDLDEFVGLLKKNGILPSTTEL